MAKRKKRRRLRPLTEWEKSDAFRAVGSRAITAFNATRHKLPKCTAIAKVSGEQCRNPAKTNGKCQCHGGRTPSGSGWHKPVWPNDGPGFERKLNRKLATLHISVKRREQQLAKATAGERERYAEWQKTHTPGSVKDRQRARSDRRHAQEIAASLGSPAPRSSDPEYLALKAKIDALEILLHDRQGRGIFG